MTSIDRLILIAAPSCCGKSTLIDKLVDNKRDDVAQKLRMGSPGDWTYVDAFYFDEGTIERLAKRGASNVVVHWTIPRPGLKIALRNLLLFNAYDKKSRINVLQSAREVSVLTLYNSRENLLEYVQSRTIRIAERRKGRKDGVIEYAEKVHEVRSLKKLYSDSKNLVPMYERWFQFCQTLNVKESYLVDLSREDGLMPASHWQTVRNSWEAES